MYKILIVSNERISKSSSNGRTLLNLLFGYESSSIAQFYIYGKKDESVVTSSFQVSDKDALNAFLHVKNQSVSNENEHKPTRKKISHSCKNMVIRNFIWMKYQWWDSRFEKFINDFSPDLVLFQAGDSPFMYSIAYRISKRWNIPLVMYNSESYVLKRRIYSSANIYSIWHFALMRSLRYWYKKVMEICSFCIYSMEELEKAYQKAYPHPGRSKTLYISSSIESGQTIVANTPEVFTVAYCGNLGVGRSDCLLEFAQTLYKVDKTAKLVICGKFPSFDLQQRICEIPIVEYRGFVSYEEVQKIIKLSSAVLHCEKDDRLIDLKYAFSTKIADSLACGKPFIVFASHDYPFVKYLEKHNAAHIAGNKNELEETLYNCINDREFLHNTVNNALNLARQNHNIQKNAEIFRQIINNMVYRKDEYINRKEV